MKKTILFAIAAIVSMASFAQEKPKQAPKTDTVYVDLSKAKMIVFKDSATAVTTGKMFSVAQLNTTSIVYGNPQYWYSLLAFMKNAKNPDFSQLDLESIQQPFLPYALEWERVIQNMQKPKQ